MSNNKEILNKIINKFGAKNAILFCEMASTMYDIKYHATKDPLSEYDFERKWWTEAYVELKKDEKI